MRRNNIRPLTEYELKYFNDRYVVLIKDDMIVVKAKTMNRQTCHSLDGFNIFTNKRKIHISKEAIQLWSCKFKDKYTLFDVQNAISILLTTYQDVTIENVSKQLSKENNLITRI